MPDLAAEARRIRQAADDLEALSQREDGYHGRDIREIYDRLFDAAGALVQLAYDADAVRAGIYGDPQNG